MKKNFERRLRDLEEKVKPQRWPQVIILHGDEIEPPNLEGIPRVIVRITITDDPKKMEEITGG